MKIVREEEFDPVIITIESREELAKLYGLSRHNGIIKAVQLDELFNKIKSIISERETELSNKWYDRLFENFGIGK